MHFYAARPGLTQRPGGRAEGETRCRKNLASRHAASRSAYEAGLLGLRPGVARLLQGAGLAVPRARGGHRRRNKKDLRLLARRKSGESEQRAGAETLNCQLTAAARAALADRSSTSTCAARSSRWTANRAASSSSSMTPLGSSRASGGTTPPRTPRLRRPTRRRGVRRCWGRRCTCTAG